MFAPPIAQWHQPVSSSSNPAGPKIAAPGKKVLNPARGQHTAVFPAYHHAGKKPFTFSDYSQNINLYYNGCGHGDSCRGCRDDKAEC